MRVGSQRPRVELAPLWTTSAGDDACDLADVAGLHLDDWQRHVLRASLGETRDGRWAAFEVGLVVPRQNGKGSILEARELAGLFLFGEPLIIHSAHLFSTTNEHRLRLERLIRKCPDLAERVKGYQGDPEGRMGGIKTGNNDMSITTVDSRGHQLGRIQFMARAGGKSGRGFTGDLVVLDEAFSLPDSVIAAMMPTMAARSMSGSPQIWYTSSAGMADSEVLNRIRRRGLAQDHDDNRLAYFEWSADESDDPDDPDTWAKANPALGIRISPDFIAAERRSMDDEQFMRERLGIWAKPGGSSAIPPRAWSQACDTTSIAGDPVAFGFDVTPLRDVGVIASASRRADGQIHIEIVDRRGGTDWIAGRLEALRQRWNPVDCVYDTSSQAASVVAAPGVRRHLTGLNNRDAMAACGEFFEAIMAGHIVHTGQGELDEAVTACRRSKGSTDLWRWSRADRSKDISPLVAATMAYRGLIHATRDDTARKVVIW